MNTDCEPRDVIADYEKTYAAELQEAKDRAKQLERDGDLYGKNFFEGKAGGLVCRDIIAHDLKARVRELENRRENDTKLIEAHAAKEIEYLKALDTLRNRIHLLGEAIRNLPDATFGFDDEERSEPGYYMFVPAGCNESDIELCEPTFEELLARIQTVFGPKDDESLLTRMERVNRDMHS